jgi:type I restriction enzyme M protein
MNLFLHGVEDFHIVNDDTLEHPAFTENGQLMKFDMVLANPPYSISQWNREGFASDKYGRNFLGVPNQNRADYAFIQHILCSMKEKSGRCAILLPHGILNRYEEQSMRTNMVKKDFVECVIAIGRNLFYNSPMEACILICRTTKSFERRGRVLFINAVDLLEKKGTESYLSDEHIKEISSYYNDFKNVEGRCSVIPNETIIENAGSLSVSLYVSSNKEVDVNSCSDILLEWKHTSDKMNQEYDSLIGIIQGENL